jgi:dephospho-CoA kinase
MKRKKIRPWIEPQASQLHNDWEFPLLGVRKLPLIIGLTGPTKCGKTTMANRLVTKYGFHYDNLVNILINHAKMLGEEDINWETLKDIARELRAYQGQDILARGLLANLQRDLTEQSRIVIDGFLHPAEIEYFIDMPSFSIVGIEANLTIRAKAAFDWYGGEYKKVKEDIKARDSYEQYRSSRKDHLAPNISACLRMSKKQGYYKKIVSALSKQTIFDPIDEIAERILKC